MGETDWRRTEILPRKTRKDIQDLTTRYYFDPDTKDFALTAKSRDAWLLELSWIMERFLAPLAPEGRPCVLDVGTGTGLLAGMLADLGCDVRGIDGAPALVAAGKEALATTKRMLTGPAGTITLEVVDWDDPPKMDGQFHAIVSRQVVCHLPDPLKTFKLWRKWLRADGVVVVIDGLWSRHGWSGDFVNLVDETPLATTQSVGAISYLLEESKFRIVDRSLLYHVNADDEDAGNVSGPRYAVIARKSHKSASRDASKRRSRASRAKRGQTRGVG